MTEFQAGDIVECVRELFPPATKTGYFYRIERMSSGVYVRIVGSPCLFVPSAFRLAFRPPAGEVWEPWNAVGAPPSGGVDVVCRSGARFGSALKDRNSFDWSDNQDPGGIIAYRPATVSGYTVRIGGVLDGAAGAIRAPDPLADFESGRQLGRSEVELEQHMGAPIDPAKIKVGDEVTVRGVVEGVSVPQTGWFYVRTEEIIDHTPKAEPLKLEDRVSPQDEPGRVGSIKGVDGDAVWVLWDDGTRETPDASRLILIAAS